MNHENYHHTSMLRICSIICFFSYTVFGQGTYTPDRAAPIKLTFYYNNVYELTTPEKSVFKREAYFNQQELFFDGVYRDYSMDNKLIADGYYAQGKLGGMQSEFYADGSTKSTIEYAANDFIIWQLMKPDKKYAVMRGSGNFSLNYYYFYDLSLKHGILQGEFNNGKRVGRWLYRDALGEKTDIEYYKNGKFLKRAIYSASDSSVVGERKEIILSLNEMVTETLAFEKSTFRRLNEYFETQIKYPANFNRNVAYPGGMKKLLLLLTQESGVPERNVVLTKMRIDEHGQVVSMSVARSVDAITDNRVLESIAQHAAQFLPAVVNGKPVASTIYLPVSSGDEWLQLFADTPTEWFMDYNNFLN